jgi:hypothetical protein
MLRTLHSTLTISGVASMTNTQQLRSLLQARVDEIVATMDADPNMQSMVRLLQSTRARVLMDVIECMDALPKESCSTAEELKRQAAERSWQGQVDRQGGSFDPSETMYRDGWR